MASTRFEWHQDRRRYLDTEADLWLSPARVRSLRETFLTAGKERVAGLAGNLAGGSLSVADWQQAMRRAIKETHVAAAALGGGGRNVMTARDWLATARQVKAQYTHLDQFAADIDEKGLSEAQVADRAGQYITAAVQGFERAQGARYGVEDLPAYPGDGGTECHGRCSCAWDFDETEDEIRATWVLSSGNSCEGCQARAAEWSPLVIGKGDGEAERHRNGKNGRRRVEVR